jgi:NADPH:quinone reductase-like Zn-dependent oxidoreductase
MKAIVSKRYGTPDILQLEDVPQPVPGDGDMLIRVRAAVVTPSDGAFRSGKPAFARLFSGLFRPRLTILGSLFAGDVVAVGSAVQRFAVGDRVIGETLNFGAHAEYIRVAEDNAITLTPASISHESAVAIYDGAMTALPFLRDTAALKPGQRILVNGASGSVGTAAVQLAKHFGADVTAVCSGPNADLVRSLGADSIIDYTMEDFTSTGPYDVIFDTVSTSSFARSKRALAPKGIYLATVPSLGILVQMLLTSRSKGKRAAISFTGLRATPLRTRDMMVISELAESGVIVPVIDRRYALEQTADAHRYVDTGRKRGNVVITV